MTAERDIEVVDGALRIRSNGRSCTAPVAAVAEAVDGIEPSRCGWMLGEPFNPAGQATSDMNGSQWIAAQQRGVTISDAKGSEWSDAVPLPLVRACLLDAGLIEVQP